MLEINHITVRSAKITRPLTFAICPDFHNGDVELLLSACQGVDAILIAGDLVDRFCEDDRVYVVLAESASGSLEQKNTNENVTADKRAIASPNAYAS